MLSNNSYLRGIFGLFRNEVISNIKYSDYKDTGCNKFLTTKEYVDKKINEDCDVGTFFSVNGNLLAYNITEAPDATTNDDYYLNSDNKCLYRYNVDDGWSITAPSSNEFNLLFTGTGQNNVPYPSSLIPNNSIVSFYNISVNSEEYSYYASHKINNPEIGQISLFTYEYEPNKIDVLRIFNDGWNDLTKSGSFILNNNDLSVFKVNYSYDSYSSKLTSLSIDCLNYLTYDNLSTIPLSVDDSDPLPVVSHNISSVITYHTPSLQNTLSNYSIKHLTYLPGTFNIRNELVHEQIYQAFAYYYVDDIQDNIIYVKGIYNKSINLFYPNDFTVIKSGYRDSSDQYNYKKDDYTTYIKNNDGSITYSIHIRNSDDILRSYSSSEPLLINNCIYIIPCLFYDVSISNNNISSNELVYITKFTTNSYYQHNFSVALLINNVISYYDEYSDSYIDNKTIINNSNCNQYFSLDLSLFAKFIISNNSNSNSYSIQLLSSNSNYLCSIDDSNNNVVISWLSDKSFSLSY